MLRGLLSRENLTVEVDGDVAPGILPEGESPRVTVYLMERDVESDSQLFWNEDEKDSYQSMYTHHNVIREILTDPEGDPISEGNIHTAYQTELDPTWNADNMYLVAFVHRDGKLGGKRMHVFNSAIGEITEATGIVRIQSGQLTTDNRQQAIYNLAGQRLSKMQKGINIIDKKKILVK